MSDAHGSCRASTALGIAVGLLLVSSPAAQAKPLRVALHVHTTVSDGAWTPERLLEDATARGLDAVIFTDSVLRHWEYGVWPARGLIKRVVEQPSIMAFGPARYAEAIRALNAPGRPLAITGCEAAPAYYWERSPLDRRGGLIHGWQQHLLLFGFDDPGVVAQVAAVPFDPYGGNPGATPYQAAIEMARRGGALVFWAHPETPHHGRHGAVEESTEAYPHLLEATSGYDGFAITYRNYLEFIEAGNVWDQLLGAYSRGQRAQPVWVIAELDWHHEGLHLDTVLTEVWAEERSPRAIFDAMRRGRMVGAIRSDGSQLRVEQFGLIDTASGRDAGLGETLSASGPVQVRIAGRRNPTARDALAMRIIRGGRLAAAEAIHGEVFDVTWTDADPAGAGYYRVVIEDASGVIVTNPMFIR